MKVLQAVASSKLAVANSFFASVLLYKLFQARLRGYGVYPMVYEAAALLVYVHAHNALAAVGNDGGQWQPGVAKTNDAISPFSSASHLLPCTISSISFPQASAFINAFCPACVLRPFLSAFCRSSRPSPFCSAGIANGQREWWHVIGHDASCANHGILTNGHAAD